VDYNRLKFLGDKKKWNAFNVDESDF
jgi:hypothetical protein